jgi:hypothetical protein
MAIAFRAAANTSYAARANTSVSKPTGTVDGDIMVMSLVLASGTSQAATLTLTPPAGWTKFGTAVALSQPDNNFHGGFHVYWKRAASEGSSYAFTHASMSSQAVITSYSGCLASGSPVDIFSQNADPSEDAVALGVITTVANTMLVLHDHGWDGAPSTPPTGMTERFDGLITAHDEARAATGATGSRTHRVNAATTPTQSYLIALKPASTVAYSLTAVAGSYAITGSSVTTPRHAWNPTATAGAYALTGSAVTATKAGNKTLTAAAGTYAVTGSPATFRSVLKIRAEAGSYALTGSAAGLIKGALGALPVFRASSSTVYGSSVNTTIAKPTGTVDGDILLAVLFQGNVAGSPAIPTPPAGWAQAGSYTVPTDGTFDGRCSVWWKRASFEPDNYTWTHPAYTTQMAMAAYSGCIDNGDPIDVSSTNSANFGGPLTATATGVTTTQVNTKLVYTGHNWTGSGTITPPTGMTERFDGLVYLADEDRPTAGATGDRTQALASPGAWSAYLFALEGAPATAGYSVQADPGSYVLTGSPASLRGTAGLRAAGGAYALTGMAATFTLSRSSGSLPIFRAIASTAYAPRSGTTTVAKPTGTANGDIMVMSLFVGSATAANIVIDTFPAGWTLVGTPTLVQVNSGSFNGKLWVMWKRASGEGASYDFLHSNTLSTEASIAAYSNGVLSGSAIAVFSQTAQNEATTNVAVATGITTTAYTKLIYVGHSDAPTSTYNLIALGGTYSINGTTVFTGRGLISLGGSYALTGSSATLRPGGVGVPPGTLSGMNVWTGSGWVEKPAKVWTGSAWVQKPVKVWNGSSWV